MAQKASGAFVKILPLPRTQRAWQMATEELKERAESLHRTIPYALANELLEAVLGGLPSGSDYRELRSALRVSEVMAGRKGRSGSFAVHAPVRGRKIKKMDVGRTIIYVRGKKRPSATPDDVKFLEDYGPWTADTIPFWPDKSKAVIVQRKVSKREADAVAKMQEANKSKVKMGLLKAGRRIKKKKKGDPGTIGRKSKAIPDVAMLAINLEFGENGSKGKPVWRKTLIHLKSSGVKNIAKKYRVIKDTFSNPRSTRYKTWPPKNKKISQREAMKFIGFQKRLGF